MNEMNRVEVGHGQSKPISLKGGNGRKGSFIDSLFGMARQESAQEHAHRMAITNHVLGEASKDSDVRRFKDVHGHIAKRSKNGTPLALDAFNINASHTVKNPTKKKATVPPSRTGGSSYALPPIGWPTESAPEKPQGHSSFLGDTIPTNPGKWQGGTVQRNPKTGKTESNPAYQDWKTRKQNFEGASANIAKLQEGNHFAPKPGVKIPNYAKKAMQPKTPKA